MSIDSCAIAADQLGKAFAKRDPGLLRDLYAEDIAIWHGATGATMGKEANIGLLSGLFDITSRLEYTNIRRHPIEGGLLQQHTLVGTFSDGIEMPSLNACMIIKVRAGQITSIEEYFDSETFSEVWSRLAALTDAA